MMMTRKAAASGDTELVPNGDFSSSDLTGYSTETCTIAVVGGQLVISPTDNYWKVYITLGDSGIQIGEDYEMTADFVSTDHPSATIIAINGYDNYEALLYITEGNTDTDDRTATDSSTKLEIKTTTNTDNNGTEFIIDNISLLRTS